MASKVQFGFLLTLVIASLFTSGCNEESDPLKTPPKHTANAEGFGARYEIAMSRSEDLPDEPPHLLSNGAADTLVAQVVYPGGCGEHDFRLGHHAARGTTRLWLHHRAGGERCSTRVHEEVRLPVPDSALGRPTTLLLMPQDSVPYVLRMNQ